MPHQDKAKKFYLGIKLSWNGPRRNNTLSWDGLSSASRNINPCKKSYIDFRYHIFTYHNHLCPRYGVIETVLMDHG